jgi:hypothetical protein
VVKCQVTTTPLSTNTICGRARGRLGGRARNEPSPRRTPCNRHCTDIPPPPARQSHPFVRLWRDPAGVHPPGSLRVARDRHTFAPPPSACTSLNLNLSALTPPCPPFALLSLIHNMLDRYILLCAFYQTWGLQLLRRCIPRPAASRGPGRVESSVEGGIPKTLCFFDARQELIFFGGKLRFDLWSVPFSAAAVHERARVCVLSLHAPSSPPTRLR